MTITSAMFNSSNFRNQSTNINHIARQGKGSLLDGMGADTQANTVTSTYGITGNQSAKFSAGQSGKCVTGYKPDDILRYSNSSHPNRGEITPFIKFCESIKNGSVSVTRFAQSSDCLALRCLRLISPCNAVTINCAVLSPSSLNGSIDSTTSCGTLADSFCDFALVLPVAISVSVVFWWVTVYTKYKDIKALTWGTLEHKVGATLIGFIVINNKARKCVNTNRASNHSVNRGNSMAMHKSTQTHPEFTWRFAECQENKATYHHVTAHTEDEARSQLPNLPLVFTARIRQEVAA